jgi:hypothetical protein
MAVVRSMLAATNTTKSTGRRKETWNRTETEHQLSHPNTNFFDPVSPASTVCMSLIVLATPAQLKICAHLAPKHFVGKSC